MGPLHAGSKDHDIAVREGALRVSWPAECHGRARLGRVWVAFLALHGEHCALHGSCARAPRRYPKSTSSSG